MPPKKHKLNIGDLVSQSVNLPIDRLVEQEFGIVLSLQGSSAWPTATIYWFTRQMTATIHQHIYFLNKVHLDKVEENNYDNKQ